MAAEPCSQLLCIKCGTNTIPTVKQPNLSKYPNRILEKLRANYIPAPHESKIIQNCVVDLRAEIVQYDAEIGRLRDATAQLVNARNALSQHAREAQALISPIRRIPPELISRILILALPDNWYTSPSGSVSLIPAQINTLWRSVAHSTGNLWSTIRLRPSRPHAVDIMNVYLSRSRDLPLSIYLAQSEREDEPNDDVLDAIMAHSARWQVLDLHLPGTVYERLSPVQGQLPRLETLSLAASSRPENNYTETLDLFSVAPRLTSVVMGQGILPFGFRLPWDQITNLRSQFASGDMDDLLDAMRWFKNLSVLRIYEPRLSRRVDEDSPRSVVLVDLQSLKIKHRARHYYIPPHIMEPFYSAISAPSVKYLSLYKLSITNGFIPMLSRTNSLLTSINFSHLLGLSEDALIQCLQLAPALTKLKFREHSSSPTCSGLLFRRLTPQASEDGNGPSGSCLVPRLRILDLSLSMATEYGGGRVKEMEIDLVHMLAARWDHTAAHRVSQFESINLNYTFSASPSGSEAKAQLRALREDGLPIRLQARE